MPRRVAVDRVQEAELVDDPADMFKQLAHHLARLTAGTELVGRAQDLEVADLPVVIALELRLVVEGVQVRETAGHEEDDEVLGPRGEVPAARGERMTGIRRGRDRQLPIHPEPTRGGEGRGLSNQRPSIE